MKILKSLFILVFTGTILVTSTSAYFSETGSSTSNTLTAGTLDLKLNGSDNVTATWNNTNMAPGDSVTASINLANTGTLTANHVEVGPVTLVVTDNGTAASPDIDTLMQVTAASYDGTDLLAVGAHQLQDSNLNGWIDLNDLTFSANSGESGALDNLSAPASGGGSTKTISLSVQFRSSAGDTYQGDSVVMSVPFVLNQTASQ